MLVNSALLLSALPAQAQQVGYVQDIEGRWLLNKSQLLSRGQHLPAGGVISNPSPQEDDHIAVANLNGEIVESRSCKVSGECSKPIKLSAVKSTRVFSAAYEAVMNLLWGEPDRYTVSRVRGEGELPEAVVRLDGDSLDLSAIFKRKDKDHYYTRLRMIHRRSTPVAGETLGPFTFYWDPSKPSSVSIPGIVPGLYELRLFARNGEDYRPTNVICWILVTNPGNYAEADSAFQEMLTLIERWDDRVTPEAKRSFLRASLSHLESRQAK